MSALGSNSTSSRNDGFSLVEVIFAAVILAIGMAAATVCLKYGLEGLDSARKTSLVGQLLQDEAERIRLENWATLEEWPPSAALENSLPAQFAQTDLARMAADGRLKVTRTIADVAGCDGLKHITLVAEWTGIDGLKRQRSYQLRYARGGISDYFYGTR